MTTSTRTRRTIRFRGRSFLALVLAPEPPLSDWMTDLDAMMQRSPGFFAGRPIIVDVSGLPLTRDELATLIADLHGRDIRITGIEGADPTHLGLGLPPPMSGGRPVGIIEVPDGAQPRKGAKAAAPAPAPTPAAPTAANSLVVDSPIRSGQSIIHPEGDVTVLGSVASGAEVVAGGSIHIYGALRGRAIAGTTGNGRARIYCRKLEAELLAIDGLYQTADSMESEFRGRPIQAWLDGDAMKIAALD